MSDWQCDAQAIFDAALPTLPPTGQVSRHVIPLTWEMKVVSDRVIARPVGFPPEETGLPDQSIHDILTSAGIVDREVGRLAQPVIHFLPDGWEEVVEATCAAFDFPASNRGYASDVRTWREAYIKKLLAL